MELDKLKQQAAELAVSQITPGMVVGLGTGSTAFHAVNALAVRMKEERFTVIGVPTSSRTAEQARRLGIPLATLEEQPVLDLAIDGADEIQAGTLDLIKGAGGALLQERLVEVSAKRLIIIADETKKVKRLGTKFAVPVEVVRFGWRTTQGRIASLPFPPRDIVRRVDKAGQPFVTDEQHYLLDCTFDPIEDASTLAQQLKAVAGVVDHGLFIGMADEAIIATEGGIERLTPSR